MTTRTIALIGLLCLGVAGGVTYTPPVQAGGYVEVQIAPPAPRYEEVVVRRGYVWAPGYWRWDGHGHHVWVAGYYVRERHGWHWEPHHWVQGPRGGWHLEEGHWAR